ncbi:MAG: hypothetical protein V8T44_07725 [Odoribacter splanchnicus]
MIEEYGLGGGAFIMLLYAVILFRVGVIGRKSMRKEVLNDLGMPDLSGFAGCRFRVDDRFTGNDQYGSLCGVITGDRDRPCLW